MKAVIKFLLLILLPCISFSQYVHRIKADTLLVTNDSCNAELILQNSTRNVNGFLYNAGNGRTEFRVINASSGSPVSSLTDNAVISWDYSTGNSKTVTLGGNRTLSISNAMNGNEGRLIVIQDATGNRKLTLPAGSLIMSASNQNAYLSSSPNSVDVLNWFYDGSKYYWSIQSTFNPLFKPSDLPNLAGWYRSDTAVSLSGSSVVSWGDISGNNRHLMTVTSGARPVLETNQLNGYPAIYGDGTKHLRTASAFPIFTTVTAYIVALQETGDNQYGVFIDADYDKGFHMRRYLTYLEIVAGSDSYSAPFGARQSLGNNIFYSIRLRSNGTTSYASVNNNTETGFTESNRVNNPAPLTLFSDPANAYFGKKKIVEILIYTEDHSAGKRAEVEEYLRRKYIHY